MLYEFTREVAQRLRNYPVSVYFGAERFDRGLVLDNKIEVRQSGAESWGPPQATRNGPAPVVWHRWIGVAVRFEVRSDRGGASVVEHQREANRIIEAFMSAALQTSQARRTPIQGHAARSPGFDGLEDGPDGWTGAVYEIFFQLGQAVPLADALATVDASTLTAQGSTVVTSGNQVQTACMPVEEP